MNPRTHSASSLVDLVQAQTFHPLRSLSETAASHWLGSICAGLIQHQISSILWAKLSPDSPFAEAIAAYGDAGLLRQVYWCQEEEAVVDPKLIALEQSMTINPVFCVINPQYPGEDFCCFLSAEISLLWLVQRSETTKIVNVIQSICPTAIATFLAGVKQTVKITEDLLPDFFHPEQLPGSANLTLVNQLIQGFTPLETATVTPPKIAPTSAQSTTFFLHATRELGIPLTHMKTALRLLEALQHKREPRQRYLNLLKQECDRQNSLLTGLQELLQINQSSLVVDANESVRIEDCVPGVVSTYQPIAEEKGIALGYTIPGDYPAIACSAADLRAILQHLLHNSLKFTPNGGKVYVKAHRQKQTIDLVVSDTGCGIEMPDIPHLFDCFYRGRNVDPASQGAGLGLTIAQHLVKRRRGTIKVSSRTGRGSYFHVSLPIFDHNTP